MRNAQSTPEEPDNIYLKTVPVPVSTRDHLLDGQFKIVNRIDEITEECRNIFDSSFVNSTRSIPNWKNVQLANPGQPFQATDNIISGLPFRRLILAGSGPHACFIYYERGGAMYPSSCLAVMELIQKKTVWVGESADKARSLDELRFILTHQRFRDSAGPVC
jgi:hypothetical protein